MDSTDKKPITYDIKKEKRFQSKKRKLEALINLLQEEENSAVPMRKKIDTGNLQDDCKELKNELKRFMKKPDIEPNFCLTDRGFKSRINLINYKPGKKVQPLYVENVYQILLRSVIGNMSPYQLSWANLEQPQNLTRTVLLVIEGLPNCHILKNETLIPNIIDIFPQPVEIASPNSSFTQLLTTMHKVTHFHVENQESYSSMFPSKKVIKIDVKEDMQKLCKIHLLLSPIQLVMENYPLPQSVFAFSKSANYTFSKDAYAPVTADSPMFAIDCEMCRTEKSPQELTSIAVVNEKHEVIYQNLVKPKSKIIDYITKFSGITKAKLKGVKTRLDDVQNDLRRILPPDAILCGQSLNCDLHALHMIHPYCIDTSIIFNDSGIRGKKDSLKYLSMIHLNENIQDSKNGHNPAEDALATMKLVQLKLEKSNDFGDACLKALSINDKNQTEISDITIKGQKPISDDTDKNQENSSSDDPDKNQVNSSSNYTDEYQGTNIANNTGENQETNVMNNTDGSKAINSADGIENITDNIHGNNENIADKADGNNENDIADNSNKKQGKSKIQDGFFPLLYKYDKKICLIGDEKTLNLYDSEFPDIVHKVVKSNIMKVVKATINHKENFDLTIAHIDFNSIEEDCNLSTELDRIVKLVYDSCSDRTMFMLLTSEIDKSMFKDIRSGIFMATVKKST